MSIALALLAAHCTADFPLQTDWMAANKLDRIDARISHTIVHYIVTLAFLLPATTPSKAFMASLCIFVIHFGIDTRRWASADGSPNWYPIAVDQTLHIVSLYLVALVVL